MNIIQSLLTAMRSFYGRILISLLAAVTIIVAALYYMVFAAEKPLGYEIESDLTPLTVAASHFVLEDMTRQIGGDDIQLISIAKPGMESHDFEPTPKDVIALYSADVFFFNGFGLDPWAEKLAPELEAKGVTVVNLSESITPLAAVEETHSDEEEKDDEHEGEEDTHGPNDPHYWLDPANLLTLSRTIETTLANTAAKKVLATEGYAERGEAYRSSVQTFQQNSNASLASCKQREIIVAHDAFQYLAKAYNITAHAIAGLEPESEPSSEHMTELVEIAKAKGITTIFFESAANPELSQTIASEIGATTALLSPVEGLTDEQVAQGDNAIAVMEDNIRALHKAMDCSSALAI